MCFSNSPNFNPTMFGLTTSNKYSRKSFNFYWIHSNQRKIWDFFALPSLSLNMNYFAHTYRTQHIDVNFDIDMRKFANFKLHQQNLEQIQEIPENGSPDRVILTEELVCDNQAIFVISNTISKFLQDQNQSGLRCEIFGFFSSRSLKMRENYVSFAKLVLLSFCISWGKCVYFSILNDKIHSYVFFDINCEFCHTNIEK